MLYERNHDNQSLGTYILYDERYAHLPIGTITLADTEWSVVDSKQFPNFCDGVWERLIIHDEFRGRGFDTALAALVDERIQVVADRILQDQVWFSFGRQEDEISVLKGVGFSARSEEVDIFYPTSNNAPSKETLYQRDYWYREKQ
jgi:GNAT superfamily N-acetyltransferase